MADLTSSALPPTRAVSGAPLRRLLGAVQGLFQLPSLRRSRRQLLDLDAHRLSDVGLSWEEAVREAEKSVLWDVPRHWLR